MAPRDPTPVTVTQVAADDRAAGAEDAPLSLGSRVGRYLILEPVGRGGMGTVYRAYDPQLDRKVAIKRVHVGGEHASLYVRQDRLLREAQALAQLSHPNVVAIHDVGAFAGGVFIAMELIDGSTLREWLDAAPRTIAEITAVLVAAGDGLAAAHRAGLVHRDVKPSNIMIGADGRVRVVDFGLARGARRSTPSPAAARDRAPSEPRARDDGDARGVDTDLTRAGSVLGTPRYMAPEQHAGDEIDARADQFSFSVCAYEALCGALPFGDEGDARTDAIVAGRRDAAAREAKLPAAVRAAIVRGLAARPEDRFPSMDELLAALRHRPRARWRPAAAGAAAITLGALATVMAWPRPSTDPCETGGDGVAAVWDARRRTEVAAGLTRTGRVHARETADRVVRTLDGFAGRWTALQRSTCQQTRVHRTLPADDARARATCLDRRLAQVDRAISLFVDADRQIVDRAVNVVDAVTDLDDCVTARADASVGAELHAGVAATQRIIDEVEVLVRAGRIAAARERAVQAVAAALELDHPATRATALLRLADVEARRQEHREAERALRQALVEAARARDAGLLAAGWVDLFASVVAQARYDEARSLEEVARVAVIAAGDAPRLASRLAVDRATLALELGDLPGARAAFEEELARVRAAPEARPGAEVSALENLGAILVEQGELADAIAHLERATELLEQRLGPHHPDVAGPLFNHALALQDQRRFAESAALLERVRAIEQAALGDDAPRVALTESALSIALFGAGRHDEARAVAARAVAALERALGPDHPTYAGALQNLALIEHELGEIDRALAQLDRVLAIRRAALGADSAEVGTTLGVIAELACERGDHAAARRGFREALAIHDRALGAGHVRTADLVVVAAGCATGEALGTLRERLVGARATLRDAGAHPSVLAAAEAALARAAATR